MTNQTYAVGTRGTVLPVINGSCFWAGGELFHGLCDAEGWIVHNGGECPVDGETFVEIEFRDGSGTPTVRANGWGWERANRYRIVPQPPAELASIMPNSDMVLCVGIQANPRTYSQAEMDAANERAHRFEVVADNWKSLYQERKTDVAALRAKLEAAKKALS